MNSKEMLAESRFYSGYSRWNEDLGRYETWEESVSRVMDMHRQKYAVQLDTSEELRGLFDFAEQMYKEKKILGAQRALQFGGDQLLKHEARMYNCSSSYCDRPAFFQETMYLLLCGCGVGFSVQNHHIDKLPMLEKRTKKTIREFTIPDDIEGWADAFGVLLSSYFEDGGTFPSYKGHRILFDFSKIRPKGAPISGGFLAPGPDGLRQSLLKCEQLLEKLVSNTNKPVKMTSICAYDFVMHMSDAVLSGGVRRSATICMFDKDDELMLKAKTGNWFVDNPQRARSNNSAILVRGDLTREEWDNIMTNVKNFGEPGFIFTEDKDFTFNPCVEIGMYPVTEDGRSGFQFCNLSEINGGMCDTGSDFLAACVAASVLGTIQAGYTNFNYISKETREITEREALIGVSVTGWMNNPDVLFNESNMQYGAETVKVTNERVAKLLGIRQAARTTCVKPSGNASTILGTASGIHGEHSYRYIRNVQMNEQEPVLAIIQRNNPKMVEKSVWSSSGTDFVVSYPIEVSRNSMVKWQLMGVKQLEYVKKAQQVWVEQGTNIELCRHPNLRHNVSNTISVDDWNSVSDYLYDNRQWFAGVSLMAEAGDKAYPQAPFTEVLTPEDLLVRYGSGAMFASGLIVDALHAFDQKLWLACDTLMGNGLKLEESSENVLKIDWVRRAKKFASENCQNDLETLVCLLKDVYNLHKWESIVKNSSDIDFATELTVSKAINVDTLGSQACAGGACEITF